MRGGPTQDEIDAIHPKAAGLSITYALEQEIGSLEQRSDAA